MSIFSQIKKREKLLVSQTARAKEAATYSARIKKINKRKLNPKSEAQFCREYGLDESQFNRHKKGRSIPSEENVLRYRIAFQAEGV